MADMLKFAKGSKAKIIPAIQEGMLNTLTYVYIEDEERLAFVDENMQVHVLRDDNDNEVMNVQSLPSIDAGDKDCLYICDGIVYVFTGEEYVPQFVDVSSDLEQLNNSVDNIETDINNIKIVLNNKLDEETDPTVPQHVKDITARDIYNWNAKSNFSGEYNDLNNKPNLPNFEIFATKNYVGEEIEKNVEGVLREESDPTVPRHVKNISVTDITTWNAKSDFSGDYKDLKNKPNAVMKINGIAPKNGEFTLNYENINNTPNPYDDTELKELIDAKQPKGDYALKSEIPSLSGYAKTSDLFSKDYNDLTNKPTIPDEYDDTEIREMISGYATKDYVDNEIANLVGSSPETLDTLEELSKALGEDPNFAATIATEVGKKADSSSIPTKVSQLTNDIGYLTEHQSLEDYALKSEIPSTEGLATESWVDGKNYLTAIPSEYVTESELDEKGYLTEHQSLEDYAKKEDLADPYDDAEVKRRLTELENRKDNDTIYDDTDVKRRLSELEAKEDKDTIYDDTEIRGKISDLETSSTTQKEHLSSLDKSLEDLENGKLDKEATYTKEVIEEKLRDAGKVKTVNGQQPDATGNVQIDTSSYDDTEVLKKISDLEKKQEEKYVTQETFLQLEQIANDTHINSLIDAKINSLESIADEILEVM